MFKVRKQTLGLDLKMNIKEAMAPQNEDAYMSTNRGVSPTMKRQQSSTMKTIQFKTLRKLQYF